MDFLRDILTFKQIINSNRTLQKGMVDNHTEITIQNQLKLLSTAQQLRVYIFKSPWASIWMIHQSMDFKTNECNDMSFNTE